MMVKTDLSTFKNPDFNPGPKWKIGLWYVFNILFLRNRLFPFVGMKRKLLRAFGANVEAGVVIKPGVNIKFPWKLSIGENTWIGEGVWIDNLDQVTIGKNCCLSQGAFLLCGNHNYKKSTFDLITAPITLEDGVWIGAKTTVCPGVIAKEHALLTVGSIATKNMEAYSIYQGNPAHKIRERKMNQ